LGERDRDHIFIEIYFWFGPAGTCSRALDRFCTTPAWQARAVANACCFAVAYSASRAHAGKSEAVAGCFSGSKSASTHAGNADAGGFAFTDSASTHTRSYAFA
jgi:hypothetical protein